MTAIKLGVRPKNFKRTVKFPMLDGSEGAIEWSLKYRTRKEFGAFVDEWQAKQQAASEAAMKAKLEEHDKAVAAAKEAGTEPPPLELLSQGELQDKIVAAGSEFVMEIADGWSLDVEFNADNVQQLCDEVPAAVAAVNEAYRIACTEGRLGN